MCNETVFNNDCPMGCSGCNEIVVGVGRLSTNQMDSLVTGHKGRVWHDRQTRLKLLTLYGFRVGKYYR